MKPVINPFLIIVFVILSCQDNKKESHVSKNILNEIFKTEKEVFDIDSKELIEIETKKGTKIYFYSGLFEIDSTQKLTLELEEYYNLKDLISKNIQTLTEDGELLESKAVINMTFKAEGQEVKARQGGEIDTELPIDFTIKDGIYNGNFNRDNQMVWNLAEEQKILLPFIDTAYLRKYGVDKLVAKPISIDSLDYYAKKCEEINRSINRDIGNNSSQIINASLFLKDFNWINVDRVVKPTGYVQIDLKLKNNDQYDYVNSFILYKGLRSFISYSNKFDRLFKNEIPLSENTFIFSIAKKDNYYFSNLIEIDIDTGKKLEIELKKTNQEEIKGFFDSF